MQTRRQFLFAAGGLAVTVAGLWALPSLESPPAPESLGIAAKANNQFALDLYRHLSAKPGNQIFSPYSVWTALAMTWTGARSATAAEMGKVLHLAENPTQGAATAGGLLRAIQGQGRQRKYQLHVANSLWGQKDQVFLPEFLRLTDEHFGAGMRLVDYKGNAEGARQQINRWVEEQTRERIKDLIASGVLNADTRLTLVNAIYFKADWDSPFKKEMTFDAPFHVSADQSVKVPTMHRTDHMAYAHGPTFQMLELPYTSGETSMLILLPKAKHGLAALEKELTWGQVGEARKQQRQVKVALALPKFKMRTQAQMGELLQALGMPLAFSDDADFSGMTGQRDLKIDKVIHQAFVEVDEKGTEAAAATAVTMKAMAAPVEEPPIEFRADHPFLYAIVEKSTGTILFMGRVVDPKPAS